MSMTQKVASRFVYTQATASDEWQVVHSLGYHPIVDIFVDFEGEKHRILPSQVVYNDVNTVTLWFTAPFTGYAVVS